MIAIEYFHSTFRLESLKKNLRSLDKMHTLVNDANI